MKIPFVNYVKEYQRIKPEIDEVIQSCLSRGDLILRDDVEQFEKNLANFVDKEYAVALNSGTDALYLALKVLDIGPRDEVILPSHTFVATAQVVNQLGATPVLTDMDDNWIDYLTVRTKAVIAAHIAGEVSHWSPGRVPMIEDACQSLGNGRVGRGMIQCYSFYPAKILGAYGDAGAITTNEKDIADEIRELSNHYKKDYSKWGINSRMDNIQAAILNVKLKYLPRALRRRQEIAELYVQYLPEWMLPNYRQVRVWQDFIIRIKRRNDLYDYLKEHGIETMKNEYPFPIQKGIKSLQFEGETLRLPINPEMTHEEVMYVISEINKFYEKW